jgi:uncharacterized membrane protein
MHYTHKIFIELFGNDLKRFETSNFIIFKPHSITQKMLVIFLNNSLLDFFSVVTTKEITLKITK